MVKLEPTQAADRRTKNRIQEHGPRFMVQKHGRPQSLGSVDAVLVRSPDSWFGWLPMDHVSIEEILDWG